jgi:chromosomal replication initiation ATPase DnaA
VITFLTLAVGAGTLSELARRFGRDLAAVHRGVERIRREIDSNADLRQTITRLSEGFK